MGNYHLTLLYSGVVLIEEDGVFYRASESSLLEDIQNLKENRRAYLDEAYFENTLKMLEAALRLVQEEGVSHE